MPSKVTNIPEGNLEINSLNFFSLAILSSSNFIFLTSSSPPPNFKLRAKKDNEIIKIDSRTSDAIALSLRFNAPIFIDKVILDEAGFDDDEKYSEEINLIDDSFFKTDMADKTINDSKDIKKISSNKIKKLLEKSILNEDYEMAAKLRDELNIRKSIK